MNPFPFGRSTWVARTSYGLIARERLWMITLDAYVRQDVHQVSQLSNQAYRIARVEPVPSAFPIGARLSILKI